jgi:hypothetical protein
MQLYQEKEDINDDNVYEEDEQPITDTAES